MTHGIRSTLLAAMMVGLVPAAARAQIPNPVPAIAAAKDARARTEAAQKKNSEALDPDQRPAPPQTPPPAAPQTPQPAQGGTAAPAPPPPTAGYTYDPNGRRDPFVSLTGRGGDLPSAGGVRPAGLAGVLVGEVTVKGVFKTGKGGYIALLQAPDNKTYIAHAGDKVLDGSVKAINQEAVVFSQDVHDPLSLVKQREVRKTIRPEGR